MTIREESEGMNLEVERDLYGILFSEEGEEALLHFLEQGRNACGWPKSLYIYGTRFEGTVMAIVPTGHELTLPAPGLHTFVQGWRCFQAAIETCIPLVDTDSYICMRIILRDRRELALLEKNAESQHQHECQYMFYGAMHLLILRRAIRAAIMKSKTRKSFGVALHQHQSVGNMIAEATTDYMTGNLFFKENIRNGLAVANLCNSTRYMRNIVKQSVKAIDRVGPVMGVLGYTLESDMGRWTQQMYRWKLAVDLLTDLDGVETERGDGCRDERLFP